MCFDYFSHYIFDSQTKSNQMMSASHTQMCSTTDRNIV